MTRREPVYRLVIRTALLVFRILGFRFTITGRENVPPEGGAVFACTHTSYFDYMYVGLIVHPQRRLVRFLAKKSIFDTPFVGWLMRTMHHISVDRAAGASSYTAAVAALERGELVGVFPESTISRAFVPRSFKTGAARMAVAADVPLLPTVTWGGQRVWTAGRRPVFTRRVPVSIAVGPAVVPLEGESAVELTARLHAAVTALSEQVQRDYPTPTPSDPADAWWQPAYLGGSAPTPERAAEIDRAAIRGELSRSHRRRQRKLARSGGRGEGRAGGAVESRGTSPAAGGGDGAGSAASGGSDVTDSTGPA